MKSNIRTFALAVLVAAALTACPHRAAATSTTAPPPPPPPPPSGVNSGKHISKVTIEMVSTVVNLVLPVLLP
jgi:hypothetical protein